MARRHVADAGAVTLAIVIHEVVKRGGSIARHPHKFGCERGRRQHLSEPPCVRVHKGREAVGDLVTWRSWQRQRGLSGESVENINKRVNNSMYATHSGV